MCKGVAHLKRDPGVNEMRKLTVILLFSIVSLTSVAQTGPFGFEKGMTREQIIALVGQKNINTATSKGEILSVKTAPKPNPAFAAYMLMISPKEGLVRVAAVGPAMQASDDGSQLKTSYDAVLQGLTHDFGQPSTKTDECNGPGILCKRNDNWMLTLYGNQRKVASTWLPTVPTQAMRQAGVHVITLQVNASSVNSGYISCDFELEGYEQYAKDRQENPTPASKKERDTTP